MTPIEGTLFDNYPPAPEQAIERLKEVSRLFLEMRHLYVSTESIRNNHGPLDPTGTSTKPLSYIDSGVG